MLDNQFPFRIGNHLFAKYSYDGLHEKWNDFLGPIKLKLRRSFLVSKSFYIFQCFSNLTQLSCIFEKRNMTKIFEKVRIFTNKSSIKFSQ